MTCRIHKLQQNEDYLPKFSVSLITSLEYNFQEMFYLLTPLSQWTGLLSCQCFLSGSAQTHINIYHTTASQEGAVLTCRRHLAISTNIFGCHNWRDGGAISIKWVMARDANILQCTEQPPPQIIIYSVEVGKSCSRQWCNTHIPRSCKSIPVNS